MLVSRHDEALGHQPGQRLANRPGTDFELRGDLVDLQLVARRDPARQDVGLEPAVGRARLTTRGLRLFRNGVDEAKHGKYIALKKTTVQGSPERRAALAAL